MNKQQYHKAIGNDYDILYGHTKDCDGSIESYIYKGPKSRGHAPPDYARLCGDPINFNTSKSWRFDPISHIVFWWGRPTDLEKEDVEYRLKRNWKIKNPIKHDILFSNPAFANKTDAEDYKIKQFISHGYGDKNDEKPPTFAQYMRYRYRHSGD